MARPKYGGQKGKTHPPSLPSGTDRPPGGWIPLRVGLLLNTLISTGLGLFIGWQMRGVEDPGITLLWSGVAAASIWVVFGGVLWLGRHIRRS